MASNQALVTIVVMRRMIGASPGATCFSVAATTVGITSSIGALPLSSRNGGASSAWLGAAARASSNRPALRRAAPQRGFVGVGWAGWIIGRSLVGWWAGAAGAAWGGRASGPPRAAHLI